MPPKPPTGITPKSQGIGATAIRKASHTNLVRSIKAIARRVRPIRKVKAATKKELAAATKLVVRDMERPCIFCVFTDNRF